MAFLSTFIVALAFAGSSESLPDALKPLANSTEAFAAAIARLDKKTAVVVADAAVEREAASNKTSRKSVLDFLGSKLNAGMPSATKADRATDDALEAGRALKAADINSKQAKLALKHARAWSGKDDLTAAETEKLDGLRKASQLADEKRAAAKKDFEEKVAVAEHATRSLLEETKEYTRSFEKRVDELREAARTHEREAKKAMNSAIKEGARAADREYNRRKIDEQTSEEARESAEMWAEHHEEAIEEASDSASDDLKRIYDPVKRLVQKTRDEAEHKDRARRDQLHRLRERGERAELVEVVGPEDEASTEIPRGMASWVMWGAGYSAAAAGALLIAVSRRRAGTGLQQPLLG